MLLLPALAFLPAPVFAQAPDPARIITAIYRQAARGKGDSGGQFVYLTPSARRRYLSSSFTALWNRAERITPKGDQNPPGFDPITNSQDPLLKSFTVRVERQDRKSATVAATMSDARRDSPDATVRFDFVHENGRWKIDEMRGSVDKKSWSIRELLRNHLAAYGKKP